MFQYNNYAYSSGVPGSQNVAAYSPRQSAAAAAASYNPFKGTNLVADDTGPRTVHRAAADRDFAPLLTSLSYLRPMPGGTSSSDVVPPPPSMSTPNDRLTSHFSNPPAPVPDGALYSLPQGRVVVHVDADDSDGDARQHHARSHSAPVVPRCRPATADSQLGGPSNSPLLWYLQSTSPSKKRTDAERRLLPSPPPPPSAASPLSRDSATNVRCRRTVLPSDVEVNGPVVADVTIPTTKRANSVTLPAASGGSGSCDPLFSRRRLRAARGRPNLYASGDYGLGSTLAGMTIVAIVALVFSAVGVQLLLRLTAASRRSTAIRDDVAKQTTNVGDSLLPASTSGSDDSGGAMITRTTVEEITVALSAVTVALDLCCLLTLCMQCFLAVKLAHCRNAELRFYHVSVFI